MNLKLKDMPLKQVVPNTLRSFFEQYPQIALAFSGGVDSAYLLYAAKVCGADVTAYFIKSQFQPQFEIEDVERLIKILGVKARIIEKDILSCEMVVSNPPNRCYYCKKQVFSTILEEAQKDGYSIVIDGTNADDDEIDRPGIKALREMKVLSPLRMSQMTKSQIREYSQRAELFTWSKPSYACLATRIRTGEPITLKKVVCVEKAEAILQKMGYSDLRVRLQGETAKIQLPSTQIKIAALNHTEIYRALSPYFKEIVLDMKGR